MQTLLHLQLLPIYVHIFLSFIALPVSYSCDLLSWVALQLVLNLVCIHLADFEELYNPDTLVLLADIIFLHPDTFSSTCLVWTQLSSSYFICFHCPFSPRISKALLFWLSLVAHLPFLIFVHDSTRSSLIQPFVSHLQWIVFSWSRLWFNHSCCAKSEISYFEYCIMDRIISFLNWPGGISSSLVCILRNFIFIDITYTETSPSIFRS